MTNNSDAFKLFPELKKQDKKDSAEIELTTKQMAALTQLAADRQNNTKNYLINNNKIEHNRLILCEPEHKTDEDAIAGVAINI